MFRLQLCRRRRPVWLDWTNVPTYVDTRIIALYTCVNRERSLRYGRRTKNNPFVYTHLCHWLNLMWEDISVFFSAIAPNPFEVSLWRGKFIWASTIKHSLLFAVDVLCYNLLGRGAVKDKAYRPSRWCLSGNRRTIKQLEFVDCLNGSQK